ncbi:discoidin domain-containing protein [Dactylosporangium sp. NPDC048998]|uniref:galactose-binding domain-containing protein n=1 Tax=Dactylosporangium sp. NPDC048998 TaxID=3363976 RepID=UPI0037198C01
MRSKLLAGALTVILAVAGAAASSAPAHAAGGPNLALGKTVTASGANGQYVAANVNDGNQGTYWESPNNAFPQWIQLDLGSATSIDQVVLKLPAGWGARTQNLSVRGGTDGTNWTDLSAPYGAVFDPANGNTVVVNFTATTVRYVRVNITANTAWPAAQLSELEVYGAGGTNTGPNLAAGRPASASSSVGGYPAGNTVDSNQGTYWESNGGAFPQWLQVDLGASRQVNRVVVKLPTGWGARNQTFAVRGSTDGTNFTDLVASAQYAFNPAAANTVTIGVTPATARYVRLNFTANSVQNAGQVAELEVYGTNVDPPQPPTAPGNLAFTEPTPGQITLTWTASTSSQGIAGYTVYADGTARTTVAGTVLTWTDTQPTTATVTYWVRARDNAGNESADSNHVTRTGTTPPSGTNLAPGKAIEASSSVFTFAAANANDGNVGTYWESNGFTSTLTLHLGANADLTSLAVKLNPDTAWGPRTQNFAVLGREQSATGFTTLTARADYAFSPSGNQNTVTIPVSGRVADVQLQFFSNTGAPGGQVAELQVFGTMAPNPDLVVTGLSWTPTSVNESTPITLSATVRNSGTAASPATSVNFALGGAVAGSAAVGALQPGASTTVTFDAGTRPIGSYPVTATVNPAKTVIEQNYDNNTFTAASPLVVAQAPGPDLQVLSITTNPASPAVGAAVSFTVAVNNRGTTAVTVTTVTRVTVGGTTLNANTGPIGAGQTVNVAIPGTWTAVAGGATIVATADATNVVAETNENNNSLSQSIVVGRGAAVPYTEYEAENGTYNGTLLTADPLRTFGHTNFATESSGRKSVRLDTAGQYVEFTSTNQANSIVVRNSVPDSPSGGGQDYTISLYADNVFVQKLTLSSHFSWLYGNSDDTESLSNTPGGDARRLFDESHALLSRSYPVGTKFKLQRDAGDSAAFYVIDLIDLEQVAPPLTQPAGCTSITQYGAIPDDGKDDTAAIQQAVMDNQNGVISCVWIPAGQWRQEQKILTPDPARGQYNQKGIRNVVIKGAGMWYSQLYTTTEPQKVVGNINHPHEGNVGFDIDDNVQISDIAIFGGTTNRKDRGHGLNGRFGKNTKISNVWIEHTNVGAWVGRDYSDTPAYWNPADGLQFTGMRIRDTYADGINFANGSRNSTVFNSSFRTTGDDSLAVWSSTYVKDQSVDVGHDNHFTNNTVQLPWRANGIAVYGGYGNVIENNLISDTMNYPGIMLATDHSPIAFSGTTTIANNGLYRCGGVFWGEQQKFGAITLFAPSSDIVGVTIRDTDISDSTYDGIQFKAGSGQYPNVAITNVRIDKSNNGAGILAMGSARGSATLTNVTITNSATGSVVKEPGSQFVFNGTPN